MLLDRCHHATMWDIYWRLEPCDIAMRKIERENGLFGTSANSRAWLTAILRHSIAYLPHPLGLHVKFSRRRQSGDVDRQYRASDADIFPDRAPFGAMRSANDALKPTPLLRTGFWLLVCIVLCGIGWGRAPRDAAFAFAACGSATVYVLTFYGVGVATDFRNGYWAVLAAMAGVFVLLSGEGDKAALEDETQLTASVRPTLSSPCNRLRKPWAAS